MALTKTGRPLDGVTVLDFSRFVAGPYLTMLLADNGGDVIKVEPLKGEETRGLDPMIPLENGSTVSAYFLRLNRAKRSICVDWISPEGKEIVRRLVAAADVVVENYRPGVMESFGFGYEACRAINPKIVYCSISGYGQTQSPHRDDPSFAIVAEAAAGIVGRLQDTQDGTPVRVGAPIGDLYPASLALAGLCMALFQRERTGEGSQVDLAMYDALLSLNENAITLTAMTGREMLPLRTTVPYAYPFGYFRAADGFISIAVLGEKVWGRFCEAIGAPDLLADEAYGSGSRRSKASDVLGARIQTWLDQRGMVEAVDLLVAHGVPAGVVANAHHIINDPQTKARQMIVEYDTYVGIKGRAVGNPIRVGGMSTSSPGPAPGPGEHTTEVLRTIARYDPAEASALVEAGIVSQWKATHSEGRR